MHHRFGWSDVGVGTWAGAPDVESELSASSDEANAAAVAGAGTSADPEASSNQDTPKEPDTPSSFVADPEGVPVSVRSSSDREAVTTLDATVLGVALGHVQHGKLRKWLGAHIQGPAHHESR